MLNHRLQLLIDTEQRRRLDAEARRRGISVGAVVREAIEAQLGGASARERRAAVRAMRDRQPTGKPIEPEELRRAIDESVTQASDVAGTTR